MKKEKDKYVLTFMAILITIIICSLLMIAEKVFALDAHEAKEFNSICISYKENRCINLKGAYHIESYEGKDTLHVVVPDPSYYPPKEIPAKKHII